MEIYDGKNNSDKNNDSKIEKSEKLIFWGEEDSSIDESKELTTPNLYNTGGNNNSYTGQELTDSIRNAVASYRKSLRVLMAITIVILLIVSFVVIPLIVDSQIEGIKTELLSELNQNIARTRNLPDNYDMMGVEVAVANLYSVVELNCSTFTNGSAGTGFIINDEGYVITNAHVILNDSAFTTRAYTSILANFYKDTTSYVMNVIGYDVDSDLALLKFDSVPNNLVTIVLGNSDNLAMGEDVVAIGNAQGLGLTICKGIISDPDKTFDEAQTVQTDTAINPGNSGGPLCNVHAEVIGVVNSKFVDESLEGLGFAIPSNTVIAFIDEAASSIGRDIDYTLSENYYIS